MKQESWKRPLGTGGMIKGIFITFGLSYTKLTEQENYQQLSNKNKDRCGILGANADNDIREQENSYIWYIGTYYI